MPAHHPADVDRLFAAALSAGDLDTAVALYEPDACYVSDVGAARGHAEIQAALSQLLAFTPTLVCHEIDVVENDDLAVLRARWTFTGTSPDGTPFENDGRSVEVVRRQSDGTWRFALDLPNGASCASAARNRLTKPAQ